MTQRIVIVGGGTGGAVLANRLADKLDLETDEAEVIVVNDGPDHVYKPTFLYIPFGKRTVEDASQPLVDLLDRRVDLVIDRVEAIDTASKQLTMASGNDLGYDYLVLATGSKLAPEQVPGLKEGGHHFYDAEGAARLRDALAAFESGHLVLSVIGVPHMCPAAPLEFVFMADEWFRELGRRDDIAITYTYPIQRIHGLEPVAEWAQPRFEEKGINAETFFNPEEIDADNQVIKTMEGTELDYDLLVAIPPHTGDPMIEAAGLGDNGWVEVDKHTLEAMHAEDVYAIGDTADVPTSKAGSVAHYEAGALADRLVSELHGQIPTDRYGGKTICFIEAGMDEGTFIEFDYDRPPVPRPENKYIHWAKLAYNESYWLTARGHM
jgi:sulfide:quinone oxidoreductase